MKRSVVVLLVFALMSAAAVSLVPAQGPAALDLFRGSVKFKPGKNAGPAKLAYKLTFGVEGLEAFDPEIHDAFVDVTGGASNFFTVIPAAFPGWKGKPGKWSAKTPEGHKIKIDAAKGLVKFSARSLGAAQPANPILVTTNLGEINAVSIEDWTESASKPGNFKFP